VHFFLQETIVLSLTCCTQGHDGNFSALTLSEQHR
jgi:hypothetical protein